MTNAMTPNILQATSAAQVAATSSRALMERHGWTTDALMQALSTDEQGRRINPRHELDVADLQTASGSAPIAKHHLDMALQQEPLNRAAVGVRRRLGQLRPQVRQAMQQIAHDAANHPRESAATLLAELIRLIEAEELQVKRRKAEVGAAMARCNEGLRPLQQEIAAATTPKTGISLLGRLMDAAVSVASSLVQAVGNGVDLVAQIMHAERLVNDREDYANMLELLNAAGVLLQEARDVAQTELARLTTLGHTMQAAIQLLDAQLGVARARLGGYPYAALDATRDADVAELCEQVGSQFMLPSTRLSDYADQSAEQMAQQLARVGLEQTRVLTADLSVKQLIERQAAALAQNADAATDLTLAAMQMGLGLAGQPMLNLAQPHPNQPPGRTLWLVGVRDASNAEFLFDDVALVGHNRRDQVQFLRLQTGLQLRDLADFAAMSARLDAVAPQRNPYVLDSLARDDGVARVFALALACGLIQVGGRGFVVQTGGDGITVGANPDEAVNALGQDTVLMAQLSAQVDALPLRTLAERLATFVSHAVGMGEEDGGLWPELAEHVQARLKLVQSQLRYAAIAPASATDTVSMNGHMDQR